jgi:hypothetical protein
MWPPGILLHRNARWIAHHRHLVHGKHRAHERAGEIVPAMHDQHAQLGVGGDGLTQFGHRSAAQIVAAIPLAGSTS